MQNTAIFDTFTQIQPATNQWTPGKWCIPERRTFISMNGDEALSPSGDSLSTFTL